MRGEKIITLWILEEREGRSESAALVSEEQDPAL
jgi:hypothetical protein